MSEDAGGCARSWQCDRPRRPIAKRLQHSPMPGLAAKAGLRSFAGRSTADDRIPGSKPPVVGSTRPFHEAEHLPGREPPAAGFPCAYVLSARVRSSRPCGARGFHNMRDRRRVRAVRRIFNRHFVVLSRIQASLPGHPDSNKFAAETAEITLIQINNVRYRTLILPFVPCRQFVLFPSSKPTQTGRPSEIRSGEFRDLHAYSFCFFFFRPECL